MISNTRYGYSFKCIEIPDNDIGQRKALRSILIGQKAVGWGELLSKMYHAFWLD